MRKKIVAIFLISLIFIMGLLTMGLSSFSLNFMSHLKGYVGYCDSVHLPFLHVIIMTEIMITAIIACLYTYIHYYGMIQQSLKRLLSMAIANLVFMAWQVIQYPLIIKASGVWGSRMSDYTVLNHPLIYVSTFYALLLILITYQNRKVIARPSFGRFVYLVAGFSLLLELAFRLSTTYEHCYG